MGTDRFENGYITDLPGATFEIMNGPRMHRALRALGLEFIDVAKQVYLVSSKHEDTPPIEYIESFGIRWVHHLLVQAIEIYNDDPTAEWVEFGAHAGGKTRVLRYRVFGRTADIMEARSEAENA